MSDKYKITDVQKTALLVTMIITSVAAYNLWMLFPVPVFYKGMAIVFFLSAMLIRTGSKTDTTYRYLCDVWMWLTVNNLIDEFFFDPRKVQWNEYFFGIIIITHATYKIVTNGKAKR